MSLNEKKYVYHRALNSEVAFRNFLDKAQNSKHTLVAEGDICWAFIDNKFIIYIYHPDVQGKSLSNQKVVELSKKDELFTLDKLFCINKDVHFILELKTGNGVLEDFFMAFKNTLIKYEVKNVLVDAFSVEQLKVFKKVVPDVKTSLHTKFIFQNYVAETTFEKPYFRLHNLYDLDFIDSLTISYATTHVNFFNLDIDKAYSHVYSSNKALNLGSIKTIDSFNKALNSNAEYIYLRSKEVLNGYTKIIKN